MNNKIVLKWSNSSYNNNPTQTSVQRSNRLGFNHPQSIIEEITRGQDHGLDPLSKDGYYIDDTITPGSHYSYRVVTHRDNEKAATMPTPMMFVHDSKTDIGYEYGSPKLASVYNIVTSPVLHVDVSRIHGYSDVSNDIIKDISSSIRRNTVGKNIYTDGDVLFDSYKSNEKTIFIANKSQSTYQLANQTSKISDTSINASLYKNIDLEECTVFFVVCCNHQIDNTLNICPGYQINFNRKVITIKQGRNKQTIKRQNFNDTNIYCMRVKNGSCCVWENNILVYKNNSKKNTITFKSTDGIDLLPNTGDKPGGLCEYMLFDKCISDMDANSVLYYLLNKYDVQHVSTSRITMV